MSKLTSPFGMETPIALVIAVMLAISAQAIAADAPEKLLGNKVTGYLAGNTVYINVVSGGPFGDGGVTPFYYGKDGAFTAALVPNPLTGTWDISEDSSYCITIPAIGKTFCTDVVKTDAGIEHHSVGLNLLIGTVDKIVPGNDAGL